MRALLASATLVAGLSFVGCHGGVRHPEPGEPNDPSYCASRPPEESNCMACSSQPGCGWCDAPSPGQATCQPGTSATAPATCQGGWAFSTEACTPPPPPPPMD